MCPLIPLQELIDLKMLQCKRVVNGECSCGPRTVCMPGHAQTVLPLPLPGCQLPPGCSCVILWITCSLFFKDTLIISQFLKK